MVKQGVEQNGLLSQHPLGELIRESASVGLSGAFRLTQAVVKSVVYFDAGKVVFAVSNVRSHRLSESARKWNFVSDQQLTAAGEHPSDVKLGLALVELGALTPERLQELFSLQAASVLRPMLLWTEGDWIFDPRVRLAENVRAQLDLGPLLMESARRLPNEFAATRFSNTNEVISLHASPPADLALQPIEAFVLSRVDAAGMHLHELLSISGLPEEETLSSVYTLAISGFLDRGWWPRAFTEHSLSTFRAVDAAVKKNQQESVETESPFETKTTPAVAQEVKKPEPEVDKQEELERFFSRVEAAEDFYDVLAVTRSADAATIKRTYHSLARRFHPDIFHQDAGTPLHTRLQASFARVAQAYEMLKDSKLRASYDLRLQAEKRMRKPSTVTSGMSSTAPPQGTHTDSSAQNAPTFSGPSAIPHDAEDAFQKGVSALDLGNIAAAVAFLAEAVRREPDVARYRGFYGRALAHNKQMRHQAETELKAAISLENSNPVFRLMLADLYRAHGMKRRAQGEAQRVLVIDPFNVDALRLLESLTTTEPN
jgi:curved DNA-binding protein CbpA